MTKRRIPRQPRKPTKPTTRSVEPGWNTRTDGDAAFKAATTARGARGH